MGESTAVQPDDAQAIANMATKQTRCLNEAGWANMPTALTWLGREIALLALITILPYAAKCTYAGSEAFLRRFRTVDTCFHQGRC